MLNKKTNFERVIEEIEEYLEQEEMAELTRKREWERKYGADEDPSHRNSDESESSQDSSEKSNNATKKNSNKYYQSNEKKASTPKRNHDMGEPHHSSDYNSRNSGKLLYKMFFFV